MAERMTTRGAVAVLDVAIVQLLEAAGITDDLTDLSINLDGRLLRIDIARLTPDGQHIDQWLCGFSVDPRNLDTFGTPVGLPGRNAQKTH